MPLPTYGQPIVNTDPLDRTDPQSFNNNVKLFFGDDDDSSIYYDGSDLIINPKEVGGGSVKVEGDLDIGGDIFVRDGNGIVIGHNAQITAIDAAELQVLGTSGVDSAAIFGRWQATVDAPNIRLVKSRGVTIGSHAIVQDDDRIGVFRYCPDDGVDFDTIAAEFVGEVDDASPAVGDIGMAFVWQQMPGGGGVLRETMRLAADGNLNILTGSFDLNSQGSLINVGAAGNDWEANALTLVGGTQQTFTVETTVTIAPVVVLLKTAAASTNSNRINFRQGDGSGDADNMQYSLLYNGGNGRFALESRDIDGSSSTGDIFRIPDGQTDIDANTNWNDNVFDDYDDAIVLSPYRDGVLNLAKRKRELIKMGVLREYDDGFIGYNDQRMAALLAGGIYQNRARIDGQYAEIDRRLKAIGA